MSGPFISPLCFPRSFTLVVQAINPTLHSQSETPLTMLLDFLAERDRYYPIFTSLSCYLEISEVVALTRTCKKLSNLYQELLSTRWNVDHSLRHYFVDDPYEFRTQLGRHNALVSGDFAHHFFNEDTSNMNTAKAFLEIFIKVGDGADAFAQYLVQAERYEIADYREV